MKKNITRSDLRKYARQDELLYIAETILSGFGFPFAKDADGNLAIDKFPSGFAQMVRRDFKKIKRKKKKKNRKE